MVYRILLLVFGIALWAPGFCDLRWIWVPRLIGAVMIGAATYWMVSAGLHLARG